MNVSFGFVYNVHPSDTCLPETSPCNNPSEHLLTNSNNQFCTCTTQRSSVWWWQPDGCSAWACLHSGQKERKKGAALVKGGSITVEKKQW